LFLLSSHLVSLVSTKFDCKQIFHNLKVLIFPEGTNLSENALRKSDKYAIENNVPKYEYVLHPRVNGFKLLFEEMKANMLIDEIHDITVVYDRPVENETDLIHGIFPQKINFFIDIFDSTDNVAIDGDWLKKRWQSKELFLKS
jgi:lysocardiolipin and lysophospholipid acyltransferase